MSYPTTKMLAAELRAVYSSGANHVTGLRAVANEALRHAEENGAGSVSDHAQREYAEAVAEAVRQACLRCFTNQNAPAAQAIKALHLPAIVVETTQAFQASQSRG